MRITTELIKPFDGQTLTFAHSFSGDHPSLPQISHSTLRFLSAGEIQKLLIDAGLRVEQQFGDFDGSALEQQSPEIITIAAL